MHQSQALHISDMPEAEDVFTVKQGLSPFFSILECGLKNNDLSNCPCETEQCFEHTLKVNDLPRMTKNVAGVLI